MSMDAAHGTGGGPAWLSWLHGRKDCFDSLVTVVFALRPKRAGVDLERGGDGGNVSGRLFAGLDIQGVSL